MERETAKNLEDLRRALEKADVTEGARKSVIAALKEEISQRRHAGDALDLSLVMKRGGLPEQDIRDVLSILWADLPVDVGNKFASGDLVRLKSGGPPLTVLEVSGSNAELGWFEGTRYHEGEFACVCLEPVPYGDEGPF